MELPNPERPRTPYRYQLRKRLSENPWQALSDSLGFTAQSEVPKLGPHRRAFQELTEYRVSHRQSLIHCIIMNFGVRGLINRPANGQSRYGPSRRAP